MMYKDWFDEYDQKMRNLHSVYRYEYDRINDPDGLSELNRWFADQKEMIRMTMVAKAKLLFEKEGD